MSTLTITLPDTIRRRVESLAEKDGVPVDNYIASVLSQRIAIADADSYVQLRAASGSAKQMLEILQAAPSNEPDPEDRIF